MITIYLMRSIIAQRTFKSFCRVLMAYWTIPSVANDN